jgi:hypothetical protein
MQSSNESFSILWPLLTGSDLHLKDKNHTHLDQPKFTSAQVEKTRGTAIWTY